MRFLNALQMKLTIGIQVLFILQISIRRINFVKSSICTYDEDRVFGRLHIKICLVQSISLLVLTITYQLMADYFNYAQYISFRCDQDSVRVSVTSKRDQY